MKVKNGEKICFGGFEAVRGHIPMRSKVILKAPWVMVLTQPPKKNFTRYTFVKLDLLFSTLKAPGHQIVWFGDPNLTYPNKDHEELSNGV